MRVLVACEFSGVVRNAFLARGHDAYSCDILPSESPAPDGAQRHYQCDVLELLADKPEHHFDLMLAHPPCQHLAVSGARHFHRKQQEQTAALDFVCALRDAPVSRIAIENPISVISTRLGKPSQIIQPWQFGHGEVKATCLWLYWLPPLRPTAVVSGRRPRVLMTPQRASRAMDRARTLPGIAAAMAEQWGSLSF